MVRVVALLSIAAGAVGASVALAATAARPPAPATYTIVMDKMAFGSLPAKLRVGDTIVWVNRDMFRHTATAADRSFNVDLAPGKSGRIVLKRAGRIAFVCTFHPGMKGVLVVAT